MRPRVCLSFMPPQCSAQLNSVLAGLGEEEAVTQECPEAMRLHQVCVSDCTGVHHEPQAQPAPEDEQCVLGCSVHHEAKGVLDIHGVPCV